MSQITPVASLYKANGQRAVRAAVSPVLVSDPELTDAEALGMAHQHSPVLEEDARQTMDGLIGDLRRLMNGMGAALLDAWRTRRANPTTTVQPLQKQWPEVRRKKQQYFPGYRPGSMPFDPGSWTANPHYVRRMQAGSLLDPDVALWKRP